MIGMFRYSVALIGILLASTIAGYAQEKIPDDKWRGVMREGDNRLVVEVRLPAAGSTDGRFVLLGNANAQFQEPQSFPLVGLTRSNGGLGFAVPVSGRIDENTIYFRLKVEGRAMTGFAWRTTSPERRTVRFVRSP